jgi:hypothetical protein
VRVVRLERDHTAADDAEAAAHLIRTVGNVRAAPLFAAAIVAHGARPAFATGKPGGVFAFLCRFLLCPHHQILVDYDLMFSGRSHWG